MVAAVLAELHRRALREVVSRVYVIDGMRLGDRFVTALFLFIDGEH